MRVVDFVTAFRSFLQTHPTVYGFIEAEDGSRYYISDAKGSNRLTPTPSNVANARKVVINL